MKKFVTFLSCLVFLINGYSQVDYTDLTPDIFIQQNDSIYFDINNDDQTDIVIYQLATEGGQTFYLLPSEHTQITFVNDTVGALFHGELIDENLNWADTNKVAFLWHAWGGNFIWGPWPNVDQAYIAIRLKSENNWYYSWLRMVNIKHIDGSWSMHLLYALDYGIETNQNQSIIAGSGLPPCATSLAGTDIDDFFDGRDIQVSFTKAIDESVFNEYRIIIAKENDPNALDLDIINELTEDRYLSILVDTADHYFSIDTILTQNFLDIDGDSILPIRPYQIHLLNVASSGNIDENILSNPSSTIILQSEVAIMEAIQARDITDNNQSSDIQITFDSPNNNNNISHYRAYIVPYDLMEEFSVKSALRLEQNYFTIIEKEHPYPYEIIIDNEQLAIDGNPIENNKYYQAVVLSVADSIYAINSRLSDPSRKFILKSPNAFYAGQNTGEGVEIYYADLVLSNTFRWDGISYPEYDYGESYIDLNRDGLDDFHLTHTDFYTAGSRTHSYNLITLRDNKVLACSHSDHRWLDILNEGDIISNDYNFVSGDISLCYEGYAEGMGSFSGGHIPVDHTGIIYYLAFEIFDEEQPQYAWLKLRGSSFQEYGFVDINAGIIKNKTTNSYRIYPNPATSIIQIESLNINETKTQLTVSIINSIGNELDELSLTKVNSRIDVSSYAAGLYFFVIRDKGVVLESHKVVIK